VDYVLGKVTHVPGSQEILNWMAIGVSIVQGGKWDDKGNFKAFVMLLATNKVDLERLVGTCFRNVQCVTKLYNDGARSFGKIKVDMCYLDISASTCCRI
jgi:hypothetical protein